MISISFTKSLKYPISTDFGFHFLTAWSYFYPKIFYYLRRSQVGVQLVQFRIQKKYKDADSKDHFWKKEASFTPFVLN